MNISILRTDRYISDPIRAIHIKSLMYFQKMFINGILKQKIFFFLNPSRRSFYEKNRTLPEILKKTGPHLKIREKPDPSFFYMKNVNKYNMIYV